MLFLHTCRLRGPRAQHGNRRQGPAALNPCCQFSQRGVCHQWAEKVQCSRGENCPCVDSHPRANLQVAEPLRRKKVVAIVILEVSLVVHAVGDHLRGVLPPLAGKTVCPAMPTLKALARKGRSATSGTLSCASTGARANAARAKTAPFFIVRNLRRSAALLAQPPLFSKIEAEAATKTAPEPKVKAKYNLNLHQNALVRFRSASPLVRPTMLPLFPKS